MTIKTEKLGALYSGDVGKAAFLGRPTHFQSYGSLNIGQQLDRIVGNHATNPGKFYGSGSTVRPPDREDLILYVNDVLVTEPYTLCNGDICEVRQIAPEDSSLEDSRDDFEPADETLQLQTDLNQTREVVANLLNANTELLRANTQLKHRLQEKTSECLQAISYSSSLVQKEEALKKRALALIFLSATAGSGLMFVVNEFLNIYLSIH